MISSESGGVTYYIGQKYEGWCDLRMCFVVFGPVAIVLVINSTSNQPACETKRTC